MPKYRKRSGEKKSFQKQLPDMSFEQFLNVLARMDSKNHAGLVKLASHFAGGNSGMNKIPRQVRSKILSGVFEDISGSQHKSDLIRGLISEHHEHNTNPHFHKGGGCMMV